MTTVLDDTPTKEMPFVLAEEARSRALAAIRAAKGVKEVEIDIAHADDDRWSLRIFVIYSRWRNLTRAFKGKTGNSALTLTGNRETELLGNGMVVTSNMPSENPEYCLPYYTLWTYVDCEHVSMSSNLDEVLNYYK